MNCLFLFGAVVLASLLDIVNARAQQRRFDPPFATERVALRFTGPPAPVNFRSSPGARRFRTRLTAAAKAGPNFADHYAIEYWG